MLAACVFAIWGVIYTAFAIFQARPGQRDDPRLRRIGGLFVVASLANSAWIFAWHYRNFPLSMVCMLRSGAAAPFSRDFNRQAG